MTVRLRYEDVFGGARFAFTDRYGGVSRAPYAELNLGDHVGDDGRAVARNRQLLADRLGLAAERVRYMNQVHGAGVAVVDGPGSDPVPQVDALVTGERDLAVAVLVADCVPVLLSDPDAGVVAVAHAGRSGLVAGVVPAAISQMRRLGAETITARVGPSVCGQCYEVPEEMRAQVSAAVPEAYGTTRHGTPSVDVAAGVQAQLRAAGIDGTRIAGCTMEDSGLFSHRRARTTGRFAGVAWLSS